MQTEQIWNVQQNGHKDGVNGSAKRLKQLEKPSGYSRQTHQNYGPLFPKVPPAYLVAIILAGKIVPCVKMKVNVYAFYNSDFL